MGVLSESRVMASCRVLYIGSAVPLETAVGLDSIQQPLRERYPADTESGVEGIDSQLTVTNTDIQLLYINQSDTVIQFPIQSLTLCAAVRCVTTINGATGEKVPKFCSLNDPQAMNSDRPALFTAVTRRTQGLKVLECHGFICRSREDALKLVKATSLAGEILKKKGAPTRSTITRPVSGISTIDDVHATQEARMSFKDSVSGGMKDPYTFERTQSINKSYANGIANGGPAMRLIPGEPIATNITAGPEFFEPVSQQGYFYSSDQTEVKKYNIARLGGDPEPPPAPEPIPDQRLPRHIVNGAPVIVGPPPTLPPPVFVRRGPVPPRKIIVGPPPPPPPMMMRPRFFSPPPPRVRPVPFMGPPPPPPPPGMMHGPPPPPPGMMHGPPPPPMYATPVFVRRRKPGSRSSSGSKSRSVTPTGLQRPVPDENTAPKNIPNGDADTSSNSSHDRPRSPPTDYEKRAGQRMSRREEYQFKYRDRDRTPTRERIPEPSPIYVAAERLPAMPYDYYVYPPRHGGYAPFTVYNPHGRSRSVPAHQRHRSKSPRKHGKRVKKVKKSKKHRDKRLNDRINKASDISTDSYAGYHSEIPVRQSLPKGYEYYPPRDFRRDENQFMNERNFSRSIYEENRRDPKPQQTAYELNDTRGHADELEADFTLY